MHHTTHKPRVQYFVEGGRLAPTVSAPYGSSWPVSLSVAAVDKGNSSELPVCHFCQSRFPRKGHALRLSPLTSMDKNSALSEPSPLLHNRNFDH